MRKRCTVVGCNPILDESTAVEHTEATGHRTANWPVRSAAGERKARQRNRTGYYAKYNTGYKNPYERGIPGYEVDTRSQSTVASIHNEIHPFSSEAFE